MKIRAPAFFYHIVSILSSLTKSKTSSIKKKAGASYTRLLLFSQKHNKGMLEKDSDDEEEETRAKGVAVHAGVDEMDLDDEHYGVTPSLLEKSEAVELEDEIDRVADDFIRKFHRQMKLQKMESFKRLQEMLQRSV